MSLPNEGSTGQQRSFLAHTVNSKIMIYSVVALMAVILFVLLLHMYGRWLLRNSRSRSNGGWEMDTGGLNKSVLELLPTFVYSKEDGKGGAALECSVCISEFQENERGRVLPRCKHSFHTACIDMWLFSHSTCPLCRATVVKDQPLAKI